MTVVRLVAPDDADVPKTIRANAKTAKRAGYGVVGERGSAKGQRVIIAGSGPTLTDEEPWHHLLHAAADQIWACNWSLPFLLGRGLPVTHGFAHDGTVGMLEDWPTRYDVHYLVASCLHPTVLASLKGSPVTFFHSYRGFKGELQLYRKAWPPSVQIGNGLNAVNRAVGLALWMGYDRITVVGADCALGAQDAVRCNGQTVEQAYHSRQPIVTGIVQGRIWRTVPDLLFSATDLRGLENEFSAVQLVGHTLPNALEEYTDSALDDLAHFDAAGQLVLGWRDSLFWNMVPTV